MYLSTAPFLDIFPLVFFPLTLLSGRQVSLLFLQSAYFSRSQILWPTSFPISWYEREYVRDLDSRLFAALHESGAVLTICNRNRINRVPSVDAWFKPWLHIGSQGIYVYGGASSETICLSFVATRKLSTSRGYEIWFDPPLGLTLQKNLLPYFFFAPRFIYFTWLAFLIFGGVSVHSSVTALHTSFG